MANSLITIQLKLDALKIQVETPTVKTSGEPASAPTGASSRATQPSGGAPNLGLEEIRAQFNALAADLKAASDSIKGIQDIASIFTTFTESLKEATSNVKATKADAPAGGASTVDDTSAKAREEQAKKQASADAEAAAASAKKTEASKEETAANKEAAQSAEENAQATKEQAEANAKSAGGMDAIIKAAARLQVQFLEGTDITKSSAAAQEKLNQIARARTAEELKLGTSASGKKSQIATLFESILPVSIDTEFKAKADKFNSTAKGLFVNFGPGVDKASEAVKNLVIELDNIRRASAARIQRDPAGVDPLREAASVRGQQEQALGRFREAGGGGNVQFQDTKAALFAASFQAQTSNILDAMKLLADKIEAGATELEIEPLEAAVKQAITGITDFSSRIVSSAASPFITRNTNLGGGATGPRQDLTPLITQNIVPKQARQELTDFQQGLLTLAQTLIKTEEVTSVLPRIFRELTKDVANFETNQRVLRQGLQFAGNFPAGGPERQEVLGGVQAALRTRIGAGGEFVTPAGTDAATSFELLNANIQKLKLSAQDLERGTKLDKVFSFTDAAGNVRKVQATVKQLGNTLETVQVRAREVSKDLFSRVTVRAALSRVATWGAAAGIVFGAINAFKGAVNTITDTESSVVKLAKVMNESKEGFDAFAKEATSAGLEVAQKFGQPLEDVLQTMITFGQQGLSFPEVEAGTEASALASVVTTLNQPQAAEALTAATEQFGLNLQDATSIVDKFNNVANNAAVTETVLAEALKKSGIAATNAGVDLDQFNGIVAAISEQTRQSGNEVGTALRFIFSRINTQEAERGLAKVGVSIKDASGNLRPFVEVITDLRDRFSSLSKAQQTQAAISVAGTRRFNTLLALIKNFDTFQKSVVNSTNSAGTSIEQAGLVAETAAFKITQLKNSAAAAAVSFGGVLSPALKVATEVASGFFNIIASLPTAVQALAVSLGAAGIAFAKFSQTFVALGDAATLPGGGVFGTLTGALTTGTSREAIAQSTPGVAATIASVAGGGGEAIFAARSIGDFARAKEGAESFSEAIKNSGRVLVDLNGQQVANTQNITKFTAVTRGYKTVAEDAFGTAGQAAATSNLGLLAMNTTVGKMSVALVGLSTRFLKAIPGISSAVTKLEGGIDKTNSAALRLVGNLLKIGASVAILIVAFKAFEAARDFLTKDGDAVAKSLEPEIAKRQKLIRELAKQQSAVERLAQSQRELLRLQVEDTQRPEEVRREAIRRGDFKSPRLEQQRLDAAQREVDTQVGFANPQLIESVDEFGNVILKTVDAFDSLALAAGTVNERLLALTQAKVAEAFIDDLDASDGFFRSLTHNVADAFDFLPFMDDVADATISVGKKFKEAQVALEDFKGTRNTTQVADAIEEANRLGIPLREVNEDIAKELDRLTENVQKAAGPVTEGYLKIIKALESAPPGQAVTTLNKLGDAMEGLAARQSAFSGVATTASDFAERFALVNSEALKGIKGSIQFNAEDTKEALNEAGFLATASTIGARTKEEFSKSFSEGDLVIVGNRQFQVEINAFGDRVVKVWNEATNRFDQVRLADVLSTDGLQQVFSFAAEGLKRQISRSVLEVTRVTTGAGRGTLLPREFDLGADRSFDLTAQQRVAQGDETLISDLISAEKALSTRRDEFKAKIETGDALITTEIVSEILKLQEAVDETSTIVKFRTKIEEVGKSFEKAIEDIERANITERITTEFSGVLGAERGLVPRNFNTPLNRADLSVEQRTSIDAPELVRFVNAVTAAEKAQGELIANSTLAIRDIDKISQDFRSSRGPGGLADQASLSQLASALSTAGEDSAVKLHQLTSDQLNEDIKQTKFLERIAAAQDLGPANLVSALTEGFRSGALTGDAEISRVESLTPEQLKDVSTSALVDFAKTQGTGTPSNIQEEIISRQVRANRGRLNLDAINARLGASTPLPGTTDARQAGQEEARTTETLELDPTTKALIDAAISAGVGQRNVPAGQIVNQIRNALSESGGEIAKGINSQLAQEGGLEQVNAGILEFLSSVSSFFDDLTPPEQAPARSIEEQESQARKRAQDIEAGARRTANSPIFKESRALAEAFLRIADTASEVEKSFEDNLISTLRDIGTSRALSDLGVAGAQAGATSGVETLSLDVGKSLSDLTGRDLTQRDSPTLINAANNQKAALDSLVKIFEDTRNSIADLTSARDEAAGRGDTSAVSAINTELSKLNLTLSVLKPQISDSADALKRFGEAITTSDAVNQLTVDIGSLFKALEQEVDLTFDRTSIESGLGNTVFSLLRPTFEQFEQGQAGFATAFERAIAGIDFQEASREITPQEADRLRGQASFERDEGVIKLAQEKENKSLQIQINAAEQIRKRLLEFASSGGEGAEQARGLFDQLTSDLESAGDIIQSSIGSRAIRNPLTGQEEDVPASQILEFKGLPSLEGLQSEVGKLAQQSRQEQAAKNAALINTPIVTAIEVLKNDVVASLLDIKEGADLGREQASNDLSAISELSVIAQDIGKLRTSEAGPAQTQIAVSINDKLESLIRERGSETVSRAAESTFVDATTNIPDTLEELVGSTSIVKETSDKLNESLAKLSTNTEDITNLFGSAKVGVENFLESLNKASSSVPSLGGTGDIQRRAAGGLIFGPGGPKDDRVPILASPGEFVVNAAAVSKFGAKNLEKINAQGSTGKQEGNKFQSGGFIGPIGQEEVDEEAERTKNNLLAASRPTGDSEKDSLRRGQSIRFDGPTGAEKFESDIFSDNLADVESRISDLPSKDQISERVKELDSREKRRILNLESKSRKRLTTQANELRGSHYVKVLEDGTISFSASPTNGAVKVGARLGRNIDVSSAKNFRADVQNRKDKISRINRIPKEAEAQESKLREERLKLIGEEENRLVDVEKQTSFLDNSQRLSSTVNSSNAQMVTEVNRAVKQLTEIRERAKTPQGRDFLRTEEEAARSNINEASATIRFWTERASKLREQNFQFKHPLTGEFVGEEKSYFLAGDSSLSDSGLNLGGIAYTNTQTLQLLREGRYAAQAAEVNSLFDDRFFRTTGNVSGGLDAILASDANPVVKVAATALSIPGQVITNAAEGTAHLIVATGGGVSGVLTGETSLLDVPGAAVETAKGLASGVKNTVVTAGEKIGEAGGSIAVGESFEETLSKVSEAGSATAEVALLAAPVIKPISLAVRNPLTAATNATRLAKNTAITAKNKVITSFKNVSKDSFDAVKGIATPAKGSAVEKAALDALKAEDALDATIARKEVIDTLPEGIELPEDLVASLNDPVPSVAASADDIGGFFRRTPVSGTVASDLQGGLGGILKDLLYGRKINKRGLGRTEAPITRQPSVPEIELADTLVDAPRPLSPQALEGVPGLDPLDASALRAARGSIGTIIEEFSPTTLPPARPLLTPSGPVLPIRKDIAAGKGTRFGQGDPGVTTSAARSQSLLEQATGFKDPVKAQQAIDRLRIPEKNLEELVGKSPQEIASFRSAFRHDFAALEDAAVIEKRAQRIERRQQLTPEQFQQKNRAKLEAERIAKIQLKASAADSLELLKKRRAVAAESFDPNKTPAAGAFKGIKLNDESILDEILGKGGSDLLKDVPFKKSLFDDYRAGRDVEGIVRDVKDEAFKAGLESLRNPKTGKLPEGVRESAFIESRHAATGLSGTPLSGKPITLVDNTEAIFGKQIPVSTSSVPDAAVGKRLNRAQTPEQIRKLKEAAARNQAAQAAQDARIAQLRAKRAEASNRPISDKQRIIEEENAKLAARRASEKADVPIPKTEQFSPEEAAEALKQAQLNKEIAAASKEIREAVRLREAGLDPVDAIDTSRASANSTKAKLSLTQQLRLLLDPKNKLAAGGKITGPGGPKSDQVPILASNGEFIVNAETVNRLGLPFFESINKGQSIGGKFQDGGVVGTTTAGGSEITVKVNTDEVASSISDAITSALESAEFPELEVATEGVTIPVEYPDNGIPLDSSSLDLNLGDSLGSAVRSRLESVEGTVDGLREDSNKVLDLVENVDFSAITSLTEDVSSIKDTLEPLEERVLIVEEKFETQKVEILNEMFTFVNEQIDNISVGTDINSRIDTQNAQNDTRFDALSDSVFQAIDVANRAMTRALARN